MNFANMSKEELQTLGAQGGRAKVAKGFSKMTKEKRVEIAAKGGRISRKKGEKK